MSYCRPNGADSDIYVIQGKSQGKVFWQCFCGKKNSYTHNQKHMLKHMLKHKKEGLKVPEYALDRMKEELKENEKK